MRTYVFGAGASLHVGYPLAKQMGRGLFEWLDVRADVGPFNFRQTAQFLRSLFHETEDIEKLITAIEEMISNHRTLGQRPSDVVLLCNCHKPALIAAIRLWFEEIRAHEATDYARFAKYVAAPGDCVLTFNYDVSLEPHLARQGKWRLGDGYGFIMAGFEDHSPVRMLNLHGSVNWRFPAGWNGRPWIDSSEIAFLGYAGRSDPNYRAPIADTAGTMILPGRCKVFFVESSFGRQHEAFWNSLWIQAGEALRRSNAVVICGYSMPEFDERARELLLNKDHSATIEVCCGGNTARLVEQLQSTGCNAHAARETHFDAWLNERISADLEPGGAIPKAAQLSPQS